MNDHSPAFRTPAVVVNVDESAPVGTLLSLESRAEDPDRGANAALTYSQEGPWGPFSLVVPPASAASANGAAASLSLRVERALDFEKTQSYEFVVRACDSASEPLCGALNVTVNVRDVNEFTPMFTEPKASPADNSADTSQTVTVYVAELLPVGNTVQRMQAVDGDQGEFGRLSYALGRPGSLTHRPFRIDPVSGHLVLEESLNAYHQRTYDLRVIAHDAGQPPREAALPVRCATIIHSVQYSTVQSRFTRFEYNADH